MPRTLWIAALAAVLSLTIMTESAFGFFGLCKKPAPAPTCQAAPTCQPAPAATCQPAPVANGCYGAAPRYAPAPAPCYTPAPAPAAGCYGATPVTYCQPTGGCR